ncbi:MAG: TA0938 family protein [Thermoplasmatales archaeon]
MKRNYKGCALCDATWGNYWREVDGENMFFCCSICADAFENMVIEVKKKTGWKKIDELKIEGNYYAGRNCVASSGENYVRYFFRHEDGKITEFDIKEQGQYHSQPRGFQNK